MKQALTHFLLEHKDRRPVSFHMPGHKGAELYREKGYGEFLDNIMDCDITEIPGADNLFQAEGAILDTMKRYKNLYQSEESYLLVNGSSGGLIAAILTAVPAGGKLIMARNCHKSIFNALSLGNISPVYAYPETVAEYGILGEVNVEEVVRCMDENPDAAAVILPSPNYYGICSDIKAIADLSMDHDFLIISDEIYEKIIYDKKHYSPAKYSDNVITLNGFSKTYAMTGLRIGYLTANEDLTEELLKIHQYNIACASTTSQRGAYEALTGPQDEVVRQCEEYERRNKALCGGLRRIGWDVPDSEGTMFVWAPIPKNYTWSEEFCMDLVEKTGVLCTPGSSFGSLGEGYVRFALVRDVETMNKIVDVIDASGILK